MSGSINLLRKVEDGTVVDVTVDSGAIDHVMEKDLAHKLGIEPTDASR